jgi:tetratricopeptide (TPR) repeat protein
MTSRYQAGGNRLTDFLYTIGQSVVHEEHKGNFGQARLIAETSVQSARESNDPIALADALIVRGMVHLLLGEPGAAIRSCEEAQRLVSRDAARCLRAASYAHLAVFLQFNTFPDRSGSNATEVDARWKGVAYVEAEQAQWQALLGQVSDSATQNEAWLVHELLPSLQSARAILQSSRFAPAVPAVGEMFRSAVQRLMALQQAAPAFGYASLAAADLCRRAGRAAEGQDHLQRALTAYQQAGDNVGLATCHLMRGDWLAAPFSSPLELNFLLLEGGSEGSDLSWTAEAKEAGRDGSDASQAREYYDEAERLFGQAAAPRGLAAIQLRRAYLKALQIDFVASAKLANQASIDFDKCGDGLNHQLARAHWALYCVGAGQRPDASQIAESIGRWGASEGSFSYALGVGILFNRAARHWLMRAGDYERALACYRLGQALFSALGATANRAQSLIDQGRTYQAIGDRTTALTLYEQALDMMEADIHVRPQVMAVLRRRVIMLATSVYQLYLQSMDPDGMERSARRLEAQLSSLPGAGDDALAAMLRELASSSNISGDLPPQVEMFSLALWDAARWSKRAHSCRCIGQST